MKRIKRLKTSLSIHTKKHFLLSNTSERKMPGGPWRPHVIRDCNPVMASLISFFSPNPNFKQTLLTCSMFLGRSCKAKEQQNSRSEETVSEWRRWRRRKKQEEERDWINGKKRIRVLTKMESSTTWSRTIKTSGSNRGPCDSYKELSQPEAK